VATPRSRLLISPSFASGNPHLRLSDATTQAMKASVRSKSMAHPRVPSRSRIEGVKMPAFTHELIVGDCATAEQRLGAEQLREASPS
jgi:hypothetical protein